MTNKKKKRYRFGIQKKLVLLVVTLALVTYSTSALFMHFLYPVLESQLTKWKISYDLFTVITLGLGIFWSGVLVYFTSGFIKKPLQKLEFVANQAAKGEISQDVRVSKSDDEIRSLGIAFNKMLHNLRSVVGEIETNFESTNEKVNEIKGSSMEAKSTMDNISRATEEIAKGTESSSLAIQESVENIEEVSALSRSAQEKANQSESLSNEMVGTLEKSKRVVESLVEGIQSISNDNEASLESIQNLEMNARKVSDIISLVGDIADQTNLLALNASIEAARAGEHGRGFAVVADEVRKLADESTNAVSGITELIVNIQKDVEIVVRKMNGQVEKAKTEANKGEKTNEAISNMTNSIFSVAETVKEINHLMTRQLEDVENSAKKTEEVSAIAQESSAGAEEVASSVHEQLNQIEKVANISDELSQYAHNLRRTIEKFKR